MKLRFANCLWWPLLWQRSQSVVWRFLATDTCKFESFIGNNYLIKLFTKMDATKRPLLIPPDFANYAEEHGVFDMYKVSTRIRFSTVQQC